MKFKERKAFTLLANRINTDLDLPIIIDEENSIDKASELEIQFIKSRIEDKINSNLALGSSNPFEMISVEEEVKRRKNKTFHELGRKIAKKENWHYWVIRHKQDRLKQPYEVICSLIDSELIPIMDFSIDHYETDEGIETGGSNGWNSFAFNQIYELGHTRRESVIKSDDIQYLKKLIKAYHEIDHDDENYEYIKRNIQNYRTLMGMKIYQDLRVIGKFAIIESILTSRKSIQVNSINFQLQNKIPLINNRLFKRIDFFKDLTVPDSFTESKIIEKLYEYRSSIAHGSKLDFDHRLQHLKNRSVADYLVDEICRKLLAHLLLEPLLISDLRKC